VYEYEYAYACLSLTITLVPLYYFHTGKSGCCVMRERRARVEKAGGISGVKNFSERIIAFKLSSKTSYFLTPILMK
jgi:hypothetical protein